MTLLHVHQLKIGYTTQLACISGLELASGDCLELSGPNGSGKSTFLKTLAGLLPDLGGHFRYHVDTCKWVSYLGQSQEIDWHFPLTVGELVLLGRQPFRKWPLGWSKADRERATWALQQVRLLEYAACPIQILSGGQRQRAFLARCLAQDARLLLLDEPLKGLDADSVVELEGLLESQRQQGLALVVVTHQPLTTLRPTQKMLFGCPQIEVRAC